MANPSIPPAGQRLPSGTVTFLFTDIEGSTRLLQQLGEKYAILLEEQQRLLREACETHNGSVVGTQGDSFFVAFARAMDAINAVVQSQRALAAQAWPDGVSVRVRIACLRLEALKRDDAVASRSVAFRNDAGHLEARDVPLEPRQSRLEQRGIDEAAAAGLTAVDESRERADGRPHARPVVEDRGPDPCRRATFVSVHHHQAGEGLDHRL